MRREDEKLRKQAHKQRHVTFRGVDKTAPPAPQKTMEFHSCNEAIAGQQRKKKKREKKKKKKQKIRNRNGRRMAPAAPQQEEPRLRLRRPSSAVVEWEHWMKTGGG
jgi:hypothetical protein